MTSQVQIPSLEEAQSDLVAAHKALRRIVNLRPKSPGPNNQNFGVAGVRALEKAQLVALKALQAQAERDLEREQREDDDSE